MLRKNMPAAKARRQIIAQRGEGVSIEEALNTDKAKAKLAEAFGQRTKKR